MRDGGRLLVTSVVRHARPGQTSGFVRVVDLARGKALMTAPFLESSHRFNDLNPRGGLRGARGVSVYEDRLLIANAERIFIFDGSWKLVGDISHPWMGGVHDILAEEDGIWVTCTTADLLLKIDWQGRLLADWEWRGDERLREALGFSSLPPVDRRLDYRDPESARDGVRNIVHLNAVTRSPEGLLVSFGRVLSVGAYRKARQRSFVGYVAKSLGLRRGNPTLADRPGGRIENSSSALVLLRDDGSAHILRRVHGISVPNHNVLRVENSLVYNDTNGGRVVAAALDGTRPDCGAEVPGHPGFLRGLAQLDARTVLVGSQAPPAVYKVDIQSGRVVSACVFEGAPHESVYGLCLLPTTFDGCPRHLG
jgi:hypothetical protein